MKGASWSALRFETRTKFTVFAAEPDVQNPIAMAWDRRGRLWVAENYTYAEQTQKFDLRLRDRVLIFEDNDGDGRFDLDCASERSRNDYLFARALVGRDFARPTVRRVTLH